MFKVMCYLVICLSSLVTVASPLPSGPTRVVRTHSAQSLGVSITKVRAWPNSQNYKNFNPLWPETYYWFEVLDSGVGYRDSQNDNDILCVGLFDLLSQTIVIGKSECQIAIDTHRDQD